MTPVHHALREVARGGKLSREDARRAVTSLLDDEVPPAVAGGFLASLAAAGETIEALAGAVDVLRSRATRLPVPELLAARAIDVCGTGGDGHGMFNVSTAAAFVVAGAGTPVAKHGNRAVSSKCGSADVLAALGVVLEMTPERAAAALGSANITFLFAPLYHPVMKKLAPLRRELGVRTVFNLAGPLSNPVDVRRQIVGVDRPERVPVVAGALLALGTERALVFSHESGGDELMPFGVTNVAEVTAGGVRRFGLRARDFGVDECAAADLRGGDSAENADLLRRILDGERGPCRDTVVMNAAAALAVAGAARDYVEGASMAAAAIDSGAAQRALVTLMDVSRGIGA
ncbi:MAG: anthranilate phosphoribosyltransferase [Acidobacteria bacterium]|nr:anthranilate phosphoribosyltransferase [Acidobacteriota bacterium]